MVDSVSPSYYAAYTTDEGFRLTGHRLDVIPSGAIGIAAYKNDNPLAGIDATSPLRLFHITEKSETSLMLVNDDGGSHAQDCYLGAIVSADRRVIYWVNEFRPLP